MPVAAHTRPERRIAMAWSDRLAADLWLSGQTDPCTHLGLASTRPISTIEILDWVDPLSVSPRSLPIGIVGGGYQPYGRSVLAVKVCACRNF